MTNTFRRHHKTIMWIIIVGTIVSFVYYLTPTARNTGGGGGYRGAVSVGSIDGEPITPPQFEAAEREASVALYMRGGKWPTPAQASEALPEIAFQQLFIASKVKELNLEVTDDAVRAFTRRLFGLQPGQAMPKDKFDEFVRVELNQKGRVGQDDFEHWVRDQVGAELLVRLYGMNGDLITSKEAEFFFRRFHEIMTVELVRFPLTNYTNQIVLADKDIQEFYDQNQSRYDLPEREQINYIRFNLTNYLAIADQMLAGISNLDAQLDAKYSSQAPESYKDDAGKQLSAEAAKAKIKEDYRLQGLARGAAQTNATQLRELLFKGRTEGQRITREEFEKFAATNGLTVVTTPPFDRQNPPRELDLPRLYLDTVFQLRESDPDDQYKVVQASNAVVLLGLERKLPTESQPLEAVRARVTEDYRNSKAMELAGQAADQFESRARTNLAGGQSFDEVCASWNIKPQTLTPFSIDTKSIPEIGDQREFEGLVRLSYEMPVNQMSPVERTATGNLLLFLKARSPVEESVVQRDMPAFLTTQREQRQYAAFILWLGREMQAHLSRPAPKPSAAQAPPPPS
jgi:hypothetical protein